MNLTISAEWELVTNLVQASSVVHDEWVLCQTRYNTLKHGRLNDAIHEETLSLDVLVKGGSPAGILFPIRPTGKKASPEAFVPFMFIQVRSRSFKQQEFRTRFGRYLDPVAPWDDHSETEIREVGPVLSTAEFA